MHNGGGGGRGAVTRKEVIAAVSISLALTVIAAFLGGGAQPGQSETAKAEHHDRRGFTLIEMSIVLVIIGLIVGSVLAGKTLIHQSELRRIYTEKTQFEQAINTFYGKYNCLPGDCANAIAFFGSAGGEGGWADADFICKNASVTNLGSTGTCNGDGNGLIGQSGNAGGCCEQYGIWQHLALARLITGAYAPTGIGASYGHEAGVNSPASSYPYGMAQWAIIRIDTATDALNGLATGAAAAGQHVLVFGGSVYNTGGWWNAPQPLLIPSDVYAIDNKYDDGMPFTGSITTNAQQGYSSGSFFGNPCTTPSGSVASTATYIGATGLWASSQDCMIYFTLKLP